MTLESILLIALLVIALASLGLLVALLTPRRDDHGDTARFAALRDDSRRIEAALRADQPAGRAHLGYSFGTVRGHGHEHVHGAHTT